MSGYEGPHRGGHTLHLRAAFLCRTPQVGNSPPFYILLVSLCEIPCSLETISDFLQSRKFRKKKNKNPLFQVGMKSAFKISKEFGNILLQQILILGPFQCTNGHARLWWLRTEPLQCALSHQDPGNFSNQKQEFNRLGRAREMSRCILCICHTFISCVLPKMY